ncbi:lipid II-degrading bacteriocin [Pseudomonas sp. RW3S2]|uniref:lipid II-degrading bacteriocin n=1 Tax=Pseudomonas sp. RW3S2 TaxID=485884 RepID=UPI0016484322|nr:lipid II-degrading bacteriocin [Pseudomonas sp. RW3S2]
MTIELPPINVTATAPGYAPPKGGVFPGPNPGYVQLEQARQRNESYGAGLWREMMIKVCNEQKTYMPDGVIGATGIINAFKIDCLTLQWADTFKAHNPSQSAAQALNYVWHNTQPPRTIPETHMPQEFSGGVLTPVAALGHFLYGGGSQASTSINSLGLNLNATPIPALDQALISSSVGSSRIVLDKVPYNTANDSWLTGLWLGNITLKIEGSVTKYADGRISFDGEARAYNDIYDANPGSWRSAFGESATQVLSEIQRHLEAENYAIEIKGAYPISLQK